MIKPMYLMLTLFTLPVFASSLPIFDTHLHYQSDSRYEPKEVIELINQSGVKYALVSSNSNDPTFELYDLAPNVIVPSLRPYRQKNELRSWMYDTSLITYLKAELNKRNYVALGEFHAFGDEVDTPVSQDMIALAKQHNLILHHHGDSEAVIRLFSQWPDARILWAHAGFADLDQIDDMLTQYPNLWADLSHRDDITTWAGFNPIWEPILIKHADRFTLGADTYNDERWGKLPLYMLDSRDWLRALPDEVAQKIAFRNAQSLFLNSR